MKRKKNIAVSASFGDAEFSSKDLEILKERLKNFSAIAVRENMHFDILTEFGPSDVICSIDPTLLLDVKDYDKLIEKCKIKKNKKKYLLRATNFYKHKMAYNTGVEEFLSLVKHAEYIVTNSYHGGIFSIQYRKNF